MNTLARDCMRAPATQTDRNPHSGKQATSQEMPELFRKCGFDVSSVALGCRFPRWTKEEAHHGLQANRSAARSGGMVARCRCACWRRQLRTAFPEEDFVSFPFHLLKRC